MNFEGPKDDDMEVRRLSPEEGAELLRDMEANIAGLEAWLEEEREKLAVLETDPSADAAEIDRLRATIWELAMEIQEQKDFIQDSREV